MLRLHAWISLAVAAACVVSCNDAGTSTPRPSASENPSRPVAVPASAPASPAPLASAPAFAPTSGEKPTVGQACSGETMSCQEPYGCDVDCAGVYDAGTATEHYCQLKTVTAKEGAENCVGVAFRGERSSRNRVKIVRAVLCDLAANLFCDHTTQRCTKVREVGAACNEDDECGRDGVCTQSACAPATPVGGSCKDKRCSSSGYCTTERVCAPSKALGQTCSLTEECREGSCFQGKCQSGDAQPRCTL
jgi:hypothetical protein